MTSIAPERLASALQAALGPRSPADPERAGWAVFDVDGTLWSGDIGHLAFSRGVAHGFIGPAAAETLRAFLMTHGLPTTGGVEALVDRLVHAEISGALTRELDAAHAIDVRRALYAVQALAFCGHSERALFAYGERLFDEVIEAGVFEFMLEVVARLRAEGVRCVCATASPECIAAGALSRLGFSRAEVIGMRAHVEDGRATTRLDRSVYGQTKVSTLTRVLGACAAPMFAFGDSAADGDRALLDWAQQGVAIFPRGRHRSAAARAGDWIVEPRPG